MTADEIRAVRAALDRVAETPDVRDAQDAARAFVDGMLRLGLARRAEPALSDRPEVRALVARAEETFPLASPALEHFAWRFGQALTRGWDGDWEGAARTRSGMEFVLDLMSETGIDWLRESFPVEEMDRHVAFRRERDGYLPDGAVPAGIPRSHWWWWGPGDEPPDRPEER